MRNQFNWITALSLALGGATLAGCQEDRGDPDMAADNRGAIDATAGDVARPAGARSGGGVGSDASAGVDSAGERTFDASGNSPARTGDSPAGARNAVSGRNSPGASDLAGPSGISGSRDAGTTSSEDDGVDTGSGRGTDGTLGGTLGNENRNSGDTGAGGGIGTGTGGSSGGAGSSGGSGGGGSQ
jgi:hypothetical protein